MSIFSTSSSSLIIQKNGKGVPELTMACMVHLYWANLLAESSKIRNGFEILHKLKESVFSMLLPVQIFGCLNHVNMDRIKRSRVKLQLWSQQMVMGTLSKLPFATDCKMETKIDV